MPPFETIGEIGWIYEWTQIEEFEKSIIEIVPRIAEGIRESPTPWVILSNLSDLPLLQRQEVIREAVRDTTTEFLAGMMKAPTDVVWVRISPPPLLKPEQKPMKKAEETYAFWEFLGPISHYPELNGNPEVIASMDGYVHASETPWEAIAMIWGVPWFRNNPTIRESIIKVAERTVKAIDCSPNPWEILDDVARIPQLKCSILKTGVLERVIANMPSSIIEIDDLDEFLHAISNYSEMLEHSKTRHLISEAMPMIMDIIRKDGYGLKSYLLEIEQIRESDDVIGVLAQTIDDAKDIVDQLRRIGSYPSLLNETPIQESIQRTLPRLLNKIPQTPGWKIGGIAYITKLDEGNALLDAISNAIEESETPWDCLESITEASHLLTKKPIQKAIQRAKPKILDALSVSSKPWEIMWSLRAVPQIVDCSDVLDLLEKRKGLLFHSVIRHPEPLSIVWCFSLIPNSSRNLEILKVCNDEFVITRCLEEFIFVGSRFQAELVTSLKKVLSDSHLSKFSDILLEGQET
ncbi:MAG: hypothetical protein ACE5H4_03515 [Candidatus Thorarchaeota archaeon]